MSGLTIQDMRRNRAAGILFEHVKAVFGGLPCTLQVVREVEALIADHRAKCKAAGIEFPEMVVLPIPRLGAIEIVRRDLEEKGIQIIIFNLTVKYPSVTAVELALAVRHAWPNYRVSNFQLEPHQRKN